MILSVKGLLSGSDLSSYVDRLVEFGIDSNVGRRMDVLKATLYDKTGVLTLPDKAEIVIYDSPTQAQAYRAIVEQDGARSLWRLNDTGLLAIDVRSGVNSTSIGSGVTKNQPGAFPGDAAMSFDGTVNADIPIGTPALLAPAATTRLSLEAWIKTSVATGTSRPAIAWLGNLGNGGYSLGLNSSNQPIFQTRFNDGTDHNGASTWASNVGDGLWHHLVGVWDGATIRLYVDGVLRAGPTGFAFANLGPNGNTLHIAFASGFAGNFNGSLDEIAWYPGALSATQVGNHYNAGLRLLAGARAPYLGTVLPLGPTSYWPMNGLTTQRDLVGGHSGTLAGTTTVHAPGPLPDGDFAITVSAGGRVTIPDDPAYAFGTGSFSYGGWFQTSANPGVAQILLWKGGSSAANTGFDIEMGSVNTINGGISDGTTMVRLSRAGALNDGLWHHVLVVVDRTAQLLRVYVDGVAVASPPSIAAIGSLTNANQVSFGASSAGGSPFSGSLAKGMIFPVALSAQQAADLYGLGLQATADLAVVDPTWAISAYNTLLNGANAEVTSADPTVWTPRLFAGYVADPDFSQEGTGGPERVVAVTAQDYTIRLLGTVCNVAYASGATDKAIIQGVFGQYLPEVDTSQVSVVTSSMPGISFPTHSLQQFLNRVAKISRALYRIDYFKRLTYGPIGAMVAPFNLSDTPDFVTTFPFEGMHFSPATSGFFNTVWIVGGQFLSGTERYVIPASLVDGVTYQFTLPGIPEPSTVNSVQVNFVEQLVGGKVGVVGSDGDPSSQGGWKLPVLIGGSPPVIAFETTPPPGASILVIGRFRYPLVLRRQSATLLAASGGVVFEKVIRDKRIRDLGLASAVADNYLAQQGTKFQKGSCLVKYRGLGSANLQPGQQIQISNNALFKSIAANPFSAVLTKVTLTLTDDINQPYDVALEWADRSDVGDYS